MKEKKIAIRLVSLLVALYLADAVYLRSPLYELTVLGPNRSLKHYNEFIPGFQKKIVTIHTSSGEDLHGWFFRVPGSKQLVIVHHGNSDNLVQMLWIGFLFTGMGRSVLFYDYEGFGQSTGQAHLKTILSNGLEVTDFAVKRLRFERPDIVTYGESMGCSVACNIMATKPTGKVILQAPFTSLPDELGDFLPIFRLYPRELFPEPHMDNIAAARAPHPPLLILHGQLDHTVPVRHAYKLYQSACQPKSLVVIEGGSHNFMKLGRDGRAKLEAAIKNFLEK